MRNTLVPLSVFSLSITSSVPASNVPTTIGATIPHVSPRFASWNFPIAIFAVAHPSSVIVMLLLLIQICSGSYAVWDPFLHFRSLNPAPSQLTACSVDDMIAFFAVSREDSIKCLRSELAPLSVNAVYVNFPVLNVLPMLMPLPRISASLKELSFAVYVSLNTSSSVGFSEYLIFAPVQIGFRTLSFVTPIYTF